MEETDQNLNAEIKLWDIVNEKELLTLKAGTEFPIKILFSPDGKMIVGDTDDGIKLWDASTGKELNNLKCFFSELSSMAFSPNGRLLASSCGRNTLVLWDVLTGQKLNVFQGHSNTVNSAVFSPDSKMLLASSLDGAQLNFGRFQPELKLKLY